MSSTTISEYPSFILALIRHGETLENTQGIIQGQLDTKLNDVGIRQAELLGKNFNPKIYNRIYSSDLSRAYDTCRLIVNNDELIKTDELLRERRFGDFEGRTVKELIQAANKAGVRAPDFIANGGESLIDVRNRVIRFIDEKILKNIEPNEKVLIVSHGGIIRTMIEYLAEFIESNSSIPPEFNRKKHIVPPNTSISEFRIFYDQNTNQIKTVECLRIHDIGHLDDDHQKQALNQLQINANVSV